MEGDERREKRKEKGGERREEGRGEGRVEGRREKRGGEWSRGKAIVEKDGRGEERRAEK